VAEPNPTIPAGISNKLRKTKHSLHGRGPQTSRQIVVLDRIAPVPTTPHGTPGLVPRDRAHPRLASAAAENHANAARQDRANRRRIENPNPPAAELNLGFRVVKTKNAWCRATMRHTQNAQKSWGLNPPPSAEANFSSRCLSAKTSKA
jgi:hypothetical protein